VILAQDSLVSRGAPMNYMRPHGYVAAHEASLGWWLLIVSAVVVLLVLVLVLIASLRRHPPARGEHALVGRTERHAGLRWIYVGGLIVPGIVLVLTNFFTIGTLNAVSTPPRPPAVTVQVIGHRWWWEVKYVGAGAEQTVVTANEIHVPVGEPVKLELTSSDVVHSFWIPQLAGKTDLNPGMVNVSWIQADTAGIYRGQCTEYCGLQHANMAAYVVAESPERFREWLATERKPATPPGDPAAAAGEAVFVKSACAACHAIRGSDALGRVGPDLTHLASRHTIAAGTLDNTRGNLAGWIANSQAIKPGNDMPTMTLRPEDLQALLAYLETLK
jgi:cytochrome c oxidase subunit 2